MDLEIKLHYIIYPIGIFLAKALLHTLVDLDLIAQLFPLLLPLHLPHHNVDIMHYYFVLSYMPSFISPPRSSSSSSSHTSQYTVVVNKRVETRTTIDWQTVPLRYIYNYKFSDETYLSPPF